MKLLLQVFKLTIEVVLLLALAGLVAGAAAQPTSSGGDGGDAGKIKRTTNEPEAVNQKASSPQRSAQQLVVADTGSGSLTSCGNRPKAVSKRSKFNANKVARIGLQQRKHSDYDDIQLKRKLSLTVNYLQSLTDELISRDAQIKTHLASWLINRQRFGDGGGVENESRRVVGSDTDKIEKRSLSGVTNIKDANLQGNHIDESAILAELQAQAAAEEKQIIDRRNRQLSVANKEKYSRMLLDDSFGVLRNSKQFADTNNQLGIGKVPKIQEDY